MHVVKPRALNTFLEGLAELKIDKSLIKNKILVVDVIDLKSPIRETARVGKTLVRLRMKSKKAEVGDSFSFSLLFCLCLTFDIYIYKEKINYSLISIKNETTLRYIH